MPGLRSKVMRFSGAAVRGIEGAERNMHARSKVLAGEKEKLAKEEQQGVMSERMGKYAQAIQQQNQQDTDRIFNEIMNDPKVEAQPKQDFAKYHRQVQEKLKNPPHSSGMNAKELRSYQDDNYKMGRKATWNEDTQSFDYRPLAHEEMSEEARTKIEYDQARAAEIREKLKKEKSVNPKTAKNIIPWEKEFNDEYRKRYHDKDGDAREGAPDQDAWVDQRVLARLEQLNMTTQADEHKARISRGAATKDEIKLRADFIQAVDHLMVGDPAATPPRAGMTREAAEAAALEALTQSERDIIQSTDSSRSPYVGPTGPIIPGRQQGSMQGPPSLRGATAPPAGKQPASRPSLEAAEAPPMDAPTGPPPAAAPVPTTPAPPPIGPRPTLEAAPMAEAQPDSIPDQYPREQGMPEAPVANVPDDVPAPSADMIAGPTASQEVIAEVDDALLALAQTLPDETSVAEMVQREIDRYEQEGKPEHAQHLREVYGSFLVEGGDRTLGELRESGTGAPEPAP